MVAQNDSSIGQTFHFDAFSPVWEVQQISPSISILIRPGCGSKLEILGSNTGHRGYAYTVAQSVQWPGVHSVVYVTVQ